MRRAIQGMPSGVNVADEAQHSAPPCFLSWAVGGESFEFSAFIYERNSLKLACRRSNVTLAVSPS